jgi:hypothetical protein
MMMANSSIFEFRKLPIKDQDRYIALAKSHDPHISSYILLEILAANIWAKENEGKDGGL